MIISDKILLTKLFRSAIKAAKPKYVISKHLPQKPKKGKIIVIGAGKASSAMATAIEKSWGYKNLNGIVITQKGYRTQTESIEIIEASHPFPDERGLKATRKIITLLNDLSSDDNVICLFSGGGSSLLTYPAQGILLREKIYLTKSLLKSGANISEINFVRKHISRVKGGGIAKIAYPAKLLTLLISDVPGDDYSVIASGPTIPFNRDYKVALDIIKKYKIEKPSSIIKYLHERSRRNYNREDSLLKFKNRNKISILSKSQDVLVAASNKAKSLGIKPIILSDSMQGSSKDLALFQSAITKQFLKFSRKRKKPIVLLSGGETTVDLSESIYNKCKGGRNSEFLLALSIEMFPFKEYSAIACDTDGRDGTENNAGAFIDDKTILRARKLDLDPLRFLRTHNSYKFFYRLNDLIVSGPTYTNVNDFRAIMIK